MFATLKKDHINILLLLGLLVKLCDGCTDNIPLRGMKAKFNSSDLARVVISEMRICVTVSKDSLGDGTLGCIMSQRASDSLVLLLLIADKPMITSADCCFYQKGRKESAQEVSSSRSSGEENSCISFQSATSGSEC